MTEVYGIQKNILYFTYFAGDDKLNLKPDLECKEIWMNLGVHPDHIIPFGIEDNFWEMGPTGPCGPSTEIHIDQSRQSQNQAKRVNKGYNDLTELWNIVFVQYQRYQFLIDKNDFKSIFMFICIYLKRLKNGNVIPLDKHHIDTGMGFERLVSILQGKFSNYDTDLFYPIIEAIEKYTQAPKYKGNFGMADKDNIDTGYRILSDHARMVTFALADGALPDKKFVIVLF